MPELPEVETVCRGLAEMLVGRRLVRVEARRPDLRAPLPAGFARRVQGRRVTRISRRAKYILVHLEDDTVLLAHLGMSGRLVIANGGPPGPHDHVIFETDDGTEIRFSDQRRFGLMTLTSERAWPRHPLIRELGPEPLDAAFDGETLAAALAGKATSIKAALLDQTVVAGLGNIYACESLYWANLSPRAAPRSAITSDPRASSATSSTAGPSTGGRARPVRAARPPASLAESSARRRRAARASSVRAGSARSCHGET